MDRCSKRDICAALLGICVAVILWITILSREVQSNVSIYPPFNTIGVFWRDIQRGGVRGNFLGNLLLFIPIGFLLPIVSGWEQKTIAIGAVFSLLIEIMQLITSRGYFDPDDVLLNSVGCVIGYGLLKVVRYLFSNKA